MAKTLEYTTLVELSDDNLYMEEYLFLLATFCCQRFSGFPGWQTMNRVFA